MGRILLSCLALWLATSATGYAQEAAASELWKIQIDGTGLGRFIDTPGYTCGSPEWSPDGAWVAFDTWRVGQAHTDSQIAVVRADGTDLRIIGIGAMPSWSPDGTQLVCHTYGTRVGSTRTAGSTHIDVMNTNGTGRETILDHWGNPRWSPRGNRIVSILNQNIGLFDLVTGIELPILPKPYPLYLGIAVSHDGNQICFCNADSGLYVATLDNSRLGAVIRPLVTSGLCRDPSFSPDDKRIVFGHVPKGSKGRRLYTVNVDGNAEPQLVPGQGSLASWSSHWSPDGKTIIFCTTAAEKHEGK